MIGSLTVPNTGTLRTVVFAELVDGTGTEERADDAGRLDTKGEPAVALDPAALDPAALGPAALGATKPDHDEQSDRDHRAGPDSRAGAVCQLEGHTCWTALPGFPLHPLPRAPHVAPSPDGKAALLGVRGSGGAFSAQGQGAHEYNGSQRNQHHRLDAPVSAAVPTPRATPPLRSQHRFDRWFR